MIGPLFPGSRPDQFIHFSGARNPRKDFAILNHKPKKRKSKTPVAKRHNIRRPGIVPTAIYSRNESAEILGCSWMTLMRAYLNGFLRGWPQGRYVKHSGQHLLDWMEAGGRTGHGGKGRGTRKKTLESAA